jgi:hypothetical protein
MLYPISTETELRAHGIWRFKFDPSRQDRRWLGRFRKAARGCGIDAVPGWNAVRREGDRDFVGWVGDEMRRKIPRRGTTRQMRSAVRPTGRGCT